MAGLLAVGEIAVLLVVVAADAVAVAVAVVVEPVVAAPVGESAAIVEASAPRALSVSLQLEHLLRRHFGCKLAIWKGIWVRILKFS